MYLDLIRLVLQDINRRKFSSFLTLFAISLGILSIFLIILASDGFSQSVEQQFEQFGSNRLYVADSLSSGAFVDGLTDSDIRAIESRSYVDTVYPYYGRTVQVKYGNEFSRQLVYGTTLKEEYFEDINVKLAQGRYPRENEKFSVVIGPLFASDEFNREVVIGSNIVVSDTKFKVVGVLESLGNPEDDSAVYFNIDALRELFDAGGDVGFADVLIVSGENVSLAGENLQTFLDNRLGEDLVEVTTPAQLLEQVNSILGIIQATLGSIAIITLVVGAFGIINTMYVIVTEKTKEIGIMKSIGARNSDILFIFVVQAGLFGLLGAILGVISGGLLAITLEGVIQATGYTFLKISINPLTGFYLLLFGFIIGVISGFLPAKEASQITIIDTLRK